MKIALKPMVSGNFRKHAFGNDRAEANVPFIVGCGMMGAGETVVQIAAKSFATATPDSVARSLAASIFGYALIGMGAGILAFSLCR